MTDLPGPTPSLIKNSLHLSIAKKKRVAQNTYEIIFRLGKNKFNFTPGQYIHISLPFLVQHDPRGNARDFSISSSPNDSYLSITTRDSGSGFKKTLLTENVQADITGPFGVFTLPPDTEKPVVLIAGGIGITPFISMLKFITENNLSYNITLLCINKAIETVPHFNTLEKLQKKYPDIKLKFLYSRLTPEKIVQEVIDIKNSLFYVAGPPVMVSDTQKMLYDLDVSQQQIKIEEFSGIREENKEVKVVDYQSIEDEMTQRYHPEIEALLQALSNSAIVSETNAEGTITFANDMFVDISRFKREELIGQNHRILKSGLHSKAFYENLWATISRGKIWRGVLKNKAKDGTYYWVDSSIAPILGKDGKPVKYISVRFLVTERQQAEEALREKIKQQNALATLSQEALANSDLVDLFNTAVSILKKTVNSEQVAILKLQPGGKSLVYMTGTGLNKAVKGKTIIPADDKNSMAGYALLGKLPTIVTDLTTESRFIGSGLLHDHFARSGICVVIQGTESPYGILQVYSTKKRIFSDSDIGFIQSIANLLANAARNQLDKRKDEFLGMASHEIKTPLTSIKTFSQLLYKHAQQQKDEKAVQFLSKIDQQINRMSKLIADLLDISRINSGKIGFNDENFNLDEVVRDIANEIQLITKKHKIILNNEIDRLIYGDKERIGQVVTNLLTNAVKYSPEADKILINTTQNNGQAIVSVQDYGIGIPKKEQDLVFSRFYKGNSINRSRLPGGLGLGLYISSEIVKRHKGRMWVNSSEGQGSTFYFSLPIKK